MVDDGWAAAPGWDERLRALERFTARAQRDSREVILVGTAPDPTAPEPASPQRHRRGAHGLELEPKPWPVDRMAALEQLRQEPLDGAEIVWLSDGVADGRRRAKRPAALRRSWPARSAAGVRRPGWSAARRCSCRQRSTASA